MKITKSTTTQEGEEYLEEKQEGGLFFTEYPIVPLEFFYI